MNEPSKTGSGRHTVAQQCWGYATTSKNGDLEARAITSDLGLNGWEISYGVLPWLQMSKQAGLIDGIGGLSIPVPEKPIEYLRDTAPASAEFLAMLARVIAFREGELGDALAEGACYAGEVLFGGRGARFLDRIYPRRGGQTEHWAGHWGPGGSVFYPWWLPPILQWCVDTRDPASDSTHQWTTHAQRYLPVYGPNRGPLSRETVAAVCERVYGRADIGDETIDYDEPAARALPAIWHSDRAMIVDSLVLCDYEHTRVFSMLSENGQADTAIMAKLFAAATGCDVSERDLDLAGERISNLHRAIDVRNHGRDRRIDETTLDAFNFPGKDDGVTLDRARFLPLLDEYYRLADAWQARRAGPKRRGRWVGESRATGMTWPRPTCSRGSRHN
jgi:hypothetical protein